MSIRSLGFAACLLSASTAFAAPGESSFTPTSLLVPLQGVLLQGPGGLAELYRCPSTAMMATADLDDGGTPLAAADACLVDMADDNALAALFAHPVDVKPGTYDTVLISLCVDPSTQGYSSYVKGSAMLNGEQYFTSSGSQVLTQQANQQGYVRVDYAGCASGVPLPAPVTVVDEQELTINAFFSLKNIAWAMLTPNGIGGCSQNDVHTQSVCAAYPIPVTYIGTTSPTLETFYVTEDQLDTTATKAGGQLLLLLDPGQRVFGGFSRRLYSATSVQPRGNYDTSIRSVHDNAPGPGYQITTFGGGGSNGGPPQEFYLRFPAFVPETHAGNYELPNHQGFVTYLAVLQP
jgi:hypothetical protein